MSIRIPILLAAVFSMAAFTTGAIAQNVAPRMPEPASFEDADYPLSALAAHEEGRVGLDLSISPSGIISDARIATSSGSDALDRAAIRIAKGRWRFAPAQQDGRAVASNAQVEANWSLPLTPATQNYLEVPDSMGASPARPNGAYEARYSDYPPAAAAGRAQGVVGLRYQVDAAGNVTDAAIVESSGNSRFDNSALRIARNRTFAPATRNGMPVSVWQGLTVSYSILPANATNAPPPCYAAPILAHDAVLVGTTPYRVEVWFDSAKYRTRWETRPVTNWIGTWVQVSDAGEPTNVLLYTEGGWMVPSETISRRLTAARDYPSGRGGCWYYDPVSILG
nr:MAG: energy transducer TonB [Hyphomicrobiales bacterium]